MGEVIQFPTKSKENTPSEDIELKEALENITKDVLEEMLTVLDEYDIDVSVPEFTYDISFVYESINSLLFKTENQYHSLQTICERIYTDKDSEEDFYDRQLELDLDD